MHEQGNSDLENSILNQRIICMSGLSSFEIGAISPGHHSQLFLVRNIQTIKVFLKWKLPSNKLEILFKTIRKGGQQNGSLRGTVQPSAPSCPWPQS